LIGDQSTAVSAALALGFMFWPTQDVNWFFEPTWTVNPKNGQAANVGLLIGFRSGRPLVPSVRGFGGMRCRCPILSASLILSQARSLIVSLRLCSALFSEMRNQRSGHGR